MSWKFEQKNGVFDISFSNGTIATEDNNISFAKHNLLCFGRINKDLTNSYENRAGTMADVFEADKFFSIAWVGYIEGIIQEKSLEFIKSSFNKSCDKDLANNLVDKKIRITDIIETNKNC